MTYTTRFKSSMAFYYPKEYILGHWSCIQGYQGMIREEIHLFIDNFKYFTFYSNHCSKHANVMLERSPILDKYHGLSQPTILYSLNNNFNETTINQIYGYSSNYKEKYDTATTIAINSMGFDLSAIQCCYLFFSTFNP